MKDKKRDIVRSLLPSCARTSAREERQHINQQHRRKVKTALRLYHQDCELLQTQEDDDIVLKINSADKNLRFRQHRMVVDRRGSDKVKPFLRWARSKTKDIDDNEEKYFKIKSLLGAENLITIHAMSHWEGDCPLNPLSYYRSYRSYYDIKKKKVLCSKDEFERAFVKCFGLYHKRMNKILKYYNPEYDCKRFRQLDSRGRGTTYCIQEVTSKFRVWVFVDKVPVYKRNIHHMWTDRKHIKKRNFCIGYNGKRLDPIDTYVKTETNTIHEKSMCLNGLIIKGPQHVENVMAKIARTIYESVKFNYSWTTMGKCLDEIARELYELFCDKHILEKR